MMRPDAHLWAMDVQHWAMDCFDAWYTVLSHDYWCMMQIIERNWAMLMYDAQHWATLQRQYSCFDNWLVTHERCVICVYNYINAPSATDITSFLFRYGAVYRTLIPRRMLVMRLSDGRFIQYSAPTLHTSSNKSIVKTTILLLQCNHNEFLFTKSSITTVTKSIFVTKKM